MARMDATLLRFPSTVTFISSSAGRCVLTTPPLSNSKKKRLTVNLFIKLTAKSHGEFSTSPLELRDGATSVKLAPYPHRDIETFLPSGEGVRHVPATMLATTVAKDPALCRLEALYVGEAYAAGQRSAFDRLKSHSTLQKILADVVTTRLDDEILLLTSKPSLSRDYVDGRHRQGSHP